MAKPVRQSSGRYRYQPTGPNRRRLSFRFGPMTSNQAAEIAGHIDNLITAAESAVSMPRRTALWLTEIGDELHDQLASARLVEPQMRRLGVPASAYDRLITSGDLTLAAINEGGFGRRFLFIGPSRNLSVLDLVDGEQVERPEEADFLFCTGLYKDDVRAGPDDYDSLLAACRQAGLPMLCANPDHQSGVLTAVMMPEGHSADTFRATTLANYDLSLGNGLSKVADRVFRIGHLGDFNDLMLIGTLGGVEMGLRDSGVPHRKGGVQAAMDRLADDPGGHRAAAE